MTAVTRGASEPDAGVEQRAVGEHAISVAPHDAREPPREEILVAQPSRLMKGLAPHGLARERRQRAADFPGDFPGRPQHPGQQRLTWPGLTPRL